jgi:hypothetical protein
MVSAQRQFFGDVFTVGSSVEGEFEVACLADEKAVGDQDGAVGIGDGEAKFAGAILRAGRRGDEQEKKDGVDQSGVDRNTAQMDSPRSAGDASRLFYSAGGRRLLDGSATTFGRERRCCSDMSSLLECCRFGLRILGNGDRVGDEAELRSAWTGEAPVPTWPVPTQAGANLGSVMGVTVFCEIRIPVPGLGGRGANDGNAVRAGKTATVRICTPTSRRCKWKIQGEGSLCASRWSVPGMWGW